MLGRLGPRLYDRALERLERAQLRERRRRLLAGLEGEVLEIGAGTGLNLPHYERAARVFALEPDPWMRREFERKLPSSRVPVDMVDGRAEELPFPDESFDAAVSTLVLCSVEDQARALAEIRRVLRPGGRLVLIEHVRSEGRLASWQDRLASLHRRLLGGCSPNRRTADAVRAAGFALEAESFELRPNPNVLTRPAFQGVARKQA